MVHTRGMAISYWSFGLDSGVAGHGLDGYPRRDAYMFMLDWNANASCKIFGRDGREDERGTRNGM